MIPFNDQTLCDVGLGDLSPTAAERTLETLQATLLYRFSGAVAAVMTEAQFAEYDAYVDADDSEGASDWIKANIPQHQLLLAVELAALKTQVKRDAPAIFAIETALDHCSDFYEPAFVALEERLLIDTDQEGL